MAQGLTLTGKPSRNLLHFSSSSFVLPSIYPIAPGDIEVFKGMALTSLILYDCNKLTGVFGVGWGMVVCWVKIGNRLRPQGNNHKNLLKKYSSFLFNSTH